MDDGSDKKPTFVFRFNFMAFVLLAFVFTGVLLLYNAVVHEAYSSGYKDGALNALNNVCPTVDFGYRCELVSVGGGSIESCRLVRDG